MFLSIIAFVMLFLVGLFLVDEEYTVSYVVVSFILGALLGIDIYETTKNMEEEIDKRVAKKVHEFIANGQVHEEEKTQENLPE
jgi:hypothetical protein